MIRKIAGVAVLATAIAVPGWSQGGYSGPSILSRGSRPIGRSGGNPIRFRVFASLGGTYGDGLTGSTTDKDGKLVETASFGSSVGFGAYGSRQGRRSSTSGAWGGTYNLYNKASYYNGLNQNLSLSHDHQLSRRWSIGAGVGATQQTSVLGGSVRNPFTDSISAPIVDLGTEVFDNRSIGISGSVGAQYQKSSRLSFGMSGGSFVTRRHSGGLVDGQGFGTGGQVSYVLNRRSQVGANYSYSTYFFPKGFGRSDVHQWMGQYSRQLTRRWQFSGGAGLYRTESQRVVSVKIDPVVAALIGQFSSAQVYHNVSQGISAQAGLSGRFGRASVSFGYFRGINPGNGVLLTSRQEGGTANVGFVARKRLNVGTYFSYGRLTQLFDGFVAGEATYDSYGGGAGTSYRLFSIVHATVNGDVRRSRFGETIPTNFSRTRYYISAGLAFSPGELPLNLW